VTSTTRARQLFEQGQVREAEKELAAYLRDHPLDAVQRAFLFELLCISGDYERAGKQLGVLAQGNPDKEMGAVLYYSALHAEKTRHRVFEKQEFSKDELVTSPPGKLNGRSFQSLTDADPDVGPRLEVFAAGAYLWIAFEYIEFLQIEAPHRLRDTLWAPAHIRTGPAFQNMDLGEILVPAIYPFSWKHSDEAVWLGRVTDWTVDELGVEYPSGQRVFIMDGEEVPFLEIRSLEFSRTQEPVSPASS
jgi:type VI secretion system protein ImpE